MMNISLRYLRHFVMAARHLSITSAATELRLSPSAVANSIDRLEDEIKVELFTRRPSKGLFLTTGGRRVLKLSKKMLEDYDEFERAISQKAGIEEGEISVGCFSISAPGFLPAILNNMRKQYPNIFVKLWEGDLEVIEAALLDGKIDLLLTYDLEISPELERETLADVPPHAVFSENDPLCEKESVTMADLAPKPLILLDWPISRRYFNSLFSASGLVPNVSYFIKNSEMIRNMVGFGFGYSIFHLKTQEKSSFGSPLECRPIVDCNWNPKMVLVYAPNAKSTFLTDKFRDECFKYFSSEVFNSMIVSGSMPSEIVTHSPAARV
jgi:DNA-binding transcriptional LysR family regulator